MQVRLMIGFIVASFMLLMLASCGGSGGNLPTTQPGAETDTGAPDGTVQPGETGLPAFNALPQPVHQLSIVGPGWFSLPPESTVAEKNTIPGLPADELPMAALGGMAYAMYGVFGFDGDNGPTSARITAEGVVGEYYIGFADYTTGSWLHTGPYTESATAQIPYVDEYSSPTAFTSQNQTCYFAVILTTGSSLTLTGVELGVHGGVLGPAAPASGRVNEAQADITFRWDESFDRNDPDFAGYVVERAPLLHGDFTPIGPAEPFMNNFYLDNTGLLDTQYRYRVASVDISGNMSVWREATGGRVTGAVGLPVAVLNMPQGPLFGPVEVTFDLSQSFDPENPGVPSPSIDQYTISFGSGMDAISSADPVLSAVLQPGCYYVSGTVVVTADPRSAYTTRKLVVYPQWEADPVVVREPDVNTYRPRMNRLQAERHTDTGLITMFGYDRSVPGFAVWQESTSGEFDLELLPLYKEPGFTSPVDFIGEPVVFRDGIIAPVALGNWFSLVISDSAGARIEDVANRDDQNEIAIASDGIDNIWLVYQADVGGADAMVITSVIDSVTTTIAPDIGLFFDAVSAEYNPSNGMVEIVYGWSDALDSYLEYVRWDPVNRIVDDESLPEIANRWVKWIDVEINPATNRPVALYHIGTTAKHAYRELMVDGVSWTAEEIIDDTAFTWSGALEFSDGTPCAAFATEAAPAQMNIWERSEAGVWTIRNTASYSADSGHAMALMAIPGDGDLILADEEAIGNLVVATCHSDGTDEVWEWPQFGTDYLPAADGQGFELHGAGGVDGLHVVWRSKNIYKGRHCISPDGGATWNDAGDLPDNPELLDLTATEDGAVYYSCYNDAFFESQLFWWNNTLSIMELRSSPSGSQSNRSFLSALPCSNTVEWSNYDELSGGYRSVSGNEDDGYMGAMVVPSDPPVWTGTRNNVARLVDPTYSTFPPRCFVVAGDSEMQLSPVGFFEGGFPSLDLLFNRFITNERHALTNPETYGCTMATSAYFKMFPFPTEVYWATHAGFTSEPIRYEVDLINGLQTANLDMPGAEEYDDPNDVEFRRTVTAGLAYGLTAVGLVASLDGNGTIFEWSHFGEWEDLPLPEGVERMSRPELIIGMNGRWHIVYKDNLYDRMMCISSL